MRRTAFMRIGIDNVPFSGKPKASTDKNPFDRLAAILYVRCRDGVALPLADAFGLPLTGPTRED
jgi:hypothetical protein